MPNPTTARAVAVAAGCLATAGALTILLSEAIETGHLTVEHVLTVVVVGLAMGAGHLFPIALAQLRLLSALGLAVVFLSATGLTVYFSVSRQAASAAPAEARALEVNSKRARLAQRIAQAEETLGTCPKGREREHGIKCGLRDAAAAECKSGNGTRCAGVSRSVETWEAAIKGYERDLDKTGPALVVAPGAEKVARAVAALTGGDDKAVAALKERIAILQPFGLSFVLEIGALVLFGYGFGGRHGRTVRPPRTETRTETRTEPNGSGEQPNGSPSRPAGGHRSARRMSRTEAEADIVTMLALGRTIPSQQTLADRWGRSKSTVHEWMEAWDAAGLTRRTSVGKCKMIAAASTKARRTLESANA